MFTHTCMSMQLHPGMAGLATKSSSWCQPGTGMVGAGASTSLVTWHSTKTASG